MKRLSLVAIGVAIALSAGAQTGPDEKKKEPAQPEGKAKVEQSSKADQEKTSQGERVNAKSNERESAKVEEAGKVSQSTTVFRNGRRSSEQLALRRSFRERNDVHFGIGSHNRVWWLTRYSIVLLDGCHYYLADDGCWYPAYGFDPKCNYTVEVVYCP